MQEITLVLVPQSLSQTINDVLKINLSHGDDQSVSFRLPVNANITNQVQISPPTAYIGLIRAGDIKKVQFEIKSKKGLVIQSIETDAWLNVTYEVAELDGK